MAAAPQQPPPVVPATLAAVTGEGDQIDPSSVVVVHFNPASLQLTISNELKDTKNNERKQYIAKSSAKLAMDLVFDTTETGADVMQTTRKLQAFLAPPPPPGQSPPKETPPPLVLFEWGTLRFKGIAENYRETIDYFSPGGVPLRSSVNLTLSRQDKVFDDAPGGAAGSTPPAGAAPGNSAISGAASPAAAAAGAGAAGAARGIAAANGEESLRFSSGPLSVTASVQLKPAAAFSAGGGAGAGAGLSGGMSLGAGLSAGAGLSLGVDGSAGAGLSLSGSIGGGGSAGISGLASLSASEGAFAGLSGSAAGPSTASLDPSRLLPAVPGARLSVDATAGFNAGGQSGSSSPAGLRADVGVTTPLKLKITFDSA